MSEHLRQFWQTRYARHGHTGWSDDTIYAYDQLERVALVRSTVERLSPQPRRALDFGCGSGDFSRLMLRAGLQVWGFDPFVQPAIREPGFRYLPTLDAVAGISPRLDLIVSVTVLDHVLDEAELLHVLRILRSRIGPGGNLLLVEYAFDATVTRPTSDYQALRRLDDWRQLLTASGWTLGSVRPVSTLPESPSDGIRAFRQRLLVKLLQPIAARQGVHAEIARELLRRYARRVFSRYGVATVAQSPLKLMRCTPAMAGPEPMDT